jgi:membrane-associated phospholipid phosphatase
MMTPILIKKQFKYYLAAQGLAIFLYYGSIRLTNRDPVELSLTYIDKAVKFHYLWGYMYISFFLLLIIALLKSPETISRRCSSVWMLNTVLASVCFYFFPTKMPLEYINDPLMNSRIMKLIWRIDGNFNCFPSLHIANALAVTYFFNLKRILPVKLFFWIWCALITYSVLSTKQHYFYDILGGALLAVINIILVQWFLGSSTEKSASTSTRLKPSERKASINVVG